MRWKSSRISASACFGALRSRLRSLCTQQRCTAARGHTSSTAHRSLEAPRREIVQAALPRRERLAPTQLQGDRCLPPSGRTPTTPSTGTLTTFPALRTRRAKPSRSEEHTSELQSPCNLVCRLLLEKKKK